jgi:DNA-binding CsgD family transcriptional regulator
MQSLFLFFLVFSVSVGLTTYVLALMVFFRSKSRLERYFLAILSFYLLIMVISTVLFYTGQTEATTRSLHIVLFTLSRISAAGMVVFGILFMHELLEFTRTARARRLAALLLGLWTVVFLGLFFYSYRALHLFREIDKVFDASDPLLYAAVLYMLLLFFIRHRRVPQSPLLKTTRSIAISAALYTPTFFLDDLRTTLFLEVGRASIHFRLRLFPLYYLVFNGLLLYYGFRYFLAPRTTAGGEQAAVSESFLSKYSITPREKELIRLLVEGYSNKKIGQLLFISPATVRNHLHNIFEKTGATNRVELIRLCRG